MGQQTEARASRMSSLRPRVRILHIVCMLAFLLSIAWLVRTNNKPHCMGHYNPDFESADQWQWDIDADWYDTYARYYVFSPLHTVVALGRRGDPDIVHTITTGGEIRLISGVGPTTTIRHGFYVFGWSTEYYDDYHGTRYYGGTRYWCSLPYIGPVLTLLAAIPILRFALACRRFCRSSRLGLCPMCSYDLRAHAPGQKCPECGTPVPAKNDTMKPSERSHP